MRPVVVATLVLLACSSAPAGNAGPSSEAQQGTLRYTALSPAGLPVVAGELQLSFPDDSTVTGTWAFAWMPGADTAAPMGPQLGQGILAGTRMPGGTLLLQLNPGNADNNVGLLAVPTEGGYAGHWDWTAFTGPRAQGDFRAELR